MTAAVLTAYLNGYGDAGVAGDASFADGRLGATIVVRETEEFVIIRGGSREAGDKLRRSESPSVRRPAEEPAPAEPGPVTPAG